ncbi:hypothetical protein V2G26_004861 [Clonostachys chloroleuca]
MLEVKKYYLSPTTLIPNSPYPLLHYPRFLAPDTKSLVTQFYDLLTSHGWQAQWIFRYGPAQKSHYHSFAHERMIVLTGHATIRFGVAGTTEDMDENTFGTGFENGGVELHVQAGDIMIIPAGVAHKTYATKADAEFKFMSPGDAHSLPPDIRSRLDDIELSGFTMMGSYPKGGGAWNFAVGGEGAAAYAGVWSIPPPELDPILGASEEGLCGIWKKKHPGDVSVIGTLSSKL